MASTKRSDGEGSVYYDASRDRWIGVLVVGWRDNKPVRRKVSAKSRADATRKLRELREKAKAGDLTAGKVPTVSEWMRYWIDEIAPGRVRPTTLPGYHAYVDGYIIPLLGHHRLDRLRPEHVEKAWRELMTTGRPGAKNPQPLSPTTALQAHRILARALKVAQQRGRIRENVATLIDAPGKNTDEMEPLTLEEARAVLAATTNPRWSVALSLGLRQGEALGLRWANVDLTLGVIHVRNALARIKGQGLVVVPVKSRAGKRSVAMPPQLHEQMSAYRERWLQMRDDAGSWWKGGDFVFCKPDGSPIDPKADWTAWRDLLASAGVRHRRLHDARHTAATMLLAQGVPTRVVMEILGHSQISVTSKYQHVVDEMHRDAAARMGGALYGD